MLHCQKQRFSLPDEVSYLNVAYMSPLPDVVEMAGYQGVAKKTLPYEVIRSDFFEPVARLKQLFARLVNAEDFERIAVVPSVSYGMANVVKNVPAQRGQNIVLVEEIFPSNYYPWKRLCDDTGATLRIVEAPPAAPGRGAFWNERLLEAIDNQTVAVTLPNVHWADGTRFDLEAVREKTKALGAFLIIDGTQSVGAMPFDVQALQPDALICAGYKWLLGPYGLGLAYYGERFDGGAPIEENWINRLDSENFEALVRYQPEYQPKAHRYSMGENSQFIAVPMLSAAIELLLEWGVEHIQDYCRELAQPYLEEFSAMGCFVEHPGWRGGHLLGVRLPEGVDWRAIKAKTEAADVFVSFRGNAVRISPHVYNENRDFERLMEAVRVCL
jgi:selenocysteine lyase/cysteine desulfurase